MLRQEQPLELHDDEVRAVVQRAHEIDQQTQSMVAARAEVEQYLRAAEEAGLSRDATLQALRERLDFPLTHPEPNQIVFAKSGDGRFYLARVQAVGPVGVEVRYFNGAEATLPVTDLQPLNLSPGTKLEYQSGSWSMWVTGEVMNYNRDANSVTMNYWGQHETVTLDRVRISPPKAGQWDATAQAWLWGTLIGLASGGAIGWLITFLAMR